MQGSIAVARQPADSAEKALVNLDIPYVYPVELTYSPISAGPGSDENTISFCFRNFGRSPAILRECWIRMTVTQLENPNERIFSTGRIHINVEDILGENETSKHFTCSAIELLPYVREIASDEVSLHVLVSITWKDVMGSVTRTEWFSWKPLAQKFIPSTQIATAT